VLKHYCTDIGPVNAKLVEFCGGIGPGSQQYPRRLCSLEAEDGIIFDPTSVKAQEIRKEANYAGIRITLAGSLDGARCPVQADIGFGDAVTPAPEETDYPVLLDDLPTPRLRVYPRYTVIAEKFHAIASLGIANSRMKDFFDLWVLTRNSELDPTVLRQAITATFERRDTALPTSTPVGLSDEFAGDSAKQIQWRAFTARNQLAAPELQVVVQHLRRFLGSVIGLQI